jgi:outer membrane protein assembly factor BamD
MSRPSYLPAAIATAAILACPIASHADLVYRPNEGWVREGGFFGNSSPVAKTADLQLQYAGDLEKKGDVSGAREALKKLIKTFPLAQQVAEARFKLGGLLEKQGRYEDAFETYDELVVKSPESKEFTSALEAMFGIAKRYMDGERRRLFGVKMFSSNERAEQMFDTIMKRAPYSRSAAQVMLFRGMMMERQGKDAEALAAYQQIVDRFPTDPIADEAQYQMGYIRLHSVKGGSYDNTDRVRAQESFEDFLNRAPQNGRTNQARENIQLVETKNRQAALDVAKFYEKTGKTKAAVLSFKDVIRDYPNTQEADYAKRRIDAIRAEKGPEAVEVPKGGGDGAKTGVPARQQAKVNTASRSDYVGPKLKSQKTAQPAEEGAPKGPSLRLPDADVSPAGDPAFGTRTGPSLPAPRVTPPSPQNP